MQPKILLLVVLFFISLLLQAQNKNQDNGYLIYTLGKDTTMIGHYQLKDNDFTTNVVVRTNLNVYRLKGRFFPNGELQFVEGYNYKPIGGKDSVLVQTYKLYHRGDSTFIEQKRVDGTSVEQYPVKAMMVGSLGPYVFMPALLANYAPTKVGDSVVSNHIILGSPRKFVIKRISDRKLIASSQVMGTFTLSLNEKGKVASIDAIGSSYNVRGTVVPYLNMDSVIVVNAKREQQLGAIGNMNKSDSILTTINTTDIKINYSRPSMRGRVIFGEVVPWNRFWRTGANRATKITLSQPIYFNGKELPAGEYSIFTLPSQNGWTIIFNKEANNWGTDYNPAHDVLRVPMEAEQLKEPVELMTIEVVPTGKDGVINVIWEKTKVSTSFTTKQ